MSADEAPDDIARVTGINDELYALDSSGQLWLRRPHQYTVVWQQLPPLPEAPLPNLTPYLVRDIYIHMEIGEGGGMQGNLRVLTRENLWQLRVLQYMNGTLTALWDKVSL